MTKNNLYGVSQEIGCKGVEVFSYLANEAILLCERLFGLLNQSLPKGGCSKLGFGILGFNFSRLMHGPRHSGNCETLQSALCLQQVSKVHRAEKAKMKR